MCEGAQGVHVFALYMMRVCASDDAVPYTYMYIYIYTH